VAFIANRDDVSAERVPLPGYGNLWCSNLDKRLAAQLIKRTLDRRDARLREMTHDLSRFSSNGQLEQWWPGRDLVCLQDGTGRLLGVIWIAEKPMPERSDYFNPELIRKHGPLRTVAIRTYGEARGHGLAKCFCEYSFARILRDQPRPHGIWYETKAANAAARHLGLSLDFFEVSGEEKGTVVGMRIA
jgi:hypothetical protein